jgi:lysophospholipase L1-like esterase
VSIAVSRTDRIGIVGDSQASRAYYVRLGDHIVQVIRNTLNPSTEQGGYWPGLPGVAAPAFTGTWPPIVPATAGGPLSWNRAVGGYTLGDVAGQIVADLAAQPATTVLIVIAGVNDAFQAIAPATSSNNLKTILDAAGAAGITKVIVVGPLCLGEVWSPANANAHDADLQATIAAMAARVALYPGFVFVNLRALVFDVLEQTLNLPSPGVFNGPLTSVDPVGNAAHLNATAVYYCAQAVLAQIVIS